MITDFHPRPVIANGLQPLFRRFGIGRLAAEIIGVFPLGGLLFAARPAAHMQQGLHVREVDVEWIDALYGDLAVGFAAMFFFEAGKKGESLAMPAFARAWTVFWLSLTCSR